MRKDLATAALFFLAAFLFLHASAPAFAEGEGRVANTAELLERWQEYDGTEVVIRGEVVGDVMRRGDHAWITVNDDHYSRAARLEAGELRGGNSGIGVWLPAGEADKIGVLGRYASKGDLVEIKGVFNSDCREHGGDFDIHAASLTVIERGRALDSGYVAGRILGASAATVFLLFTLVPYLRRRAREMRAARALLADEEEREG